MKKLLLFAIIIFLVACSSEPELKELDLITYGIPVKIHAPDSTKVTVKDRVVMKDVVIKKGDGKEYSVQLFFSDASKSDVASLLSDYRKEQESDPYFSKFIKEDTDGFVYESRIDSNNINYGFTRVKIKAGKEFIFQSAMIGTYSLDEIEKMYESVK